MGFRLDLASDPGKDVRRMLREQLVRARKQLTASADPVAAVHEARKALKRARALVRLIRPGIGREAAGEANATLRDLGRQLSGQRDADVLSETVAHVAAQSEGQVGPSHVKAVRAMIERKRASAPLPPMTEVAAGLDAAIARMDALAFDAITGRVVRKGYVRAYGKGRDLVPLAYAEHHDETFHDLRKAVQTHWRHCGVLRDLWPEAMAVRIDAARELSQLFGMDHDLSVLALFVEEADSELKPAGRARIDAVCRRLQRDLRAEARPLVLRLFAASPRGMSEWLDALWIADADASSSRRTAPQDDDHLASV